MWVAVLLDWCVFRIKVVLILIWCLSCVLLDLGFRPRFGCLINFVFGLNC